MLNKLIPTQMYIRAFLFMTIVCSVVIVMFSLLLTREISDKAFQEIDQFTKNRVNQISTNTEFLLQSLKFYGLRIYDDPTIKKWLTTEENSVPLQIAVGETLKNYMASQPFIYTIYLINPRIRQVYDQITWQGSMDDFYDQEILDKIKYDKPKNLTFQEHTTQGKTFLSLIIPNNPNDRKMDGYLVILLSKEMLQKYLLLLDTEYQSEVSIVNGSNKVILGHMNQDMVNIIAPLVGKQTSGRLDWGYNKNIWSVRYAEMKTEGWRIYHFTPLHIWKKNIYEMEWLILGFSIALLHLLLLSLYWNSRRNFKPFSDLAQKIKTNMGIGKALEASKEVDVIDQGFVSLLAKVNQMDQSLRSNHHTFKEEYLRQWILNGKRTWRVEHTLLQESPLAGLEFLHLAVLRIAGYVNFTESYNFDSRKLLKYAMGNIAQEIMKKNGWNCEVIDFGTDHIVLLIPTVSLTESICLDGLLMEVKMHIKKWLNLSVTIAVSESYTADEKLNQTYERVYELSMLQYVSGEDRIYFENHLSTYSDLIEIRIDEEKISELILSVRSKNVETMKQVLSNIVEQMRTLPYDDCMHQFIHIIYSVIKVFKRPESITGVKGIGKYLERFSNLAEAGDWLEKQLICIIESLQQRTNSRRKEEIVDEIIDFVMKNIHNPILTIDDVAEHVSLSKNYVRQIFKDYYDNSLSEYIVSQRIKQVKLLLKTTDLAIADIAELSGFQTKSNFFTTFKKMTGMTPNQYRLGH